MNITCMRDLEMTFRVERQECFTRPWTVLDSKGRQIFRWDCDRPMPATFKTELDALRWVERHGLLVPA